MNLFAMGDLHLAQGVDKPMHIFGKHWAQHLEKIQEDWMLQVTPEDFVLIPGDISWANTLEEARLDLQWLNKLPGHKICIRGNHDYWWDRPGKLNKAYEHITFLQNDCFCIGELALCGSRGWDCNPKEGDSLEAQDKMIQRECIRLKLSLDAAMKKGCQRIWVMLHYPPAALGETTSQFITLMQQYPVERVIYGHLHDEISWQGTPLGCIEGITYTLVSADYLNFQLLKIGSLA